MGSPTTCTPLSIQRFAPDATVVPAAEDPRLALPPTSKWPSFTLVSPLNELTPQSERPPLPIFVMPAAPPPSAMELIMIQSEENPPSTWNVRVAPPKDNWPLTPGVAALP